ncbi:hypothetical protein SAMN04489712_105288 [Thermomonospora echinospora]|uniref:Uncharacterized protein n=1 Tax=Thermomonospora echinospora TaxID=1992 RepID=A0A1H6ABM4_9ACTN|nr:hypothetical protein [Thermomonospora echinospora]SEG45146.1 hypothetical protein SAMN04489712_105288 [Thermomonospora echinospora]
MHEPTTGELSRSLADAKTDFRERSAALSARIDTMTPLALYQAHVEGARREHDELAADIAALSARLDAEREQRENAERQRAADRRMTLTAIFTALLAPLALMLLQFYVISRGRA